MFTVSTMSTIQISRQSVLIDKRRRSGDRRTVERRNWNTPVQIERRRSQERRQPEDRRRQDLHALYMQASHLADRLRSELAKVSRDNPISRLLVVQRFLLDHRPHQDNAWIMKWARRLRDTYDDSDRMEMCRDVFRALRDDEAAQIPGG
jgi:hypothetical protein